MTSDGPGPAADPAADLRADLTGAFGLPVWGSRMSGFGIGSIFMLEIGQPRLVHNTPRMQLWWGQWHLGVHMATWRIETPDAVLAASGADREEMKRGVAALDGKVLVDSGVEAPSMSATFFFADGTRLRLFTASRDRDQWRLFRPDEMIRVVGTDYSWALKRPDEPWSDDTDRLEGRR